MLFYSGKYEGGMVCGPSPHLCIFANERPDLIKLSSDRWKVFEIVETEMPFGKKHVLHAKQINVSNIDDRHSDPGGVVSSTAESIIPLLLIF